MHALRVVLLSLALTAGAVAQPTGANTPFEFNGLVQAGERTLVCVTSLPERHSRWIAVGAQQDGIKVSSYDASNQQVVIESAGRTHTVTLKLPAANASSGTVTANIPSGPLPMATANARVAVTNEEKEREARFLVSDLLEIGMIQRKAYEEAQKKKAAAQAEQGKAEQQKKEPAEKR